ncbi:MAG: isochorismatase family cysteine hydrolase [Bacillota bacterium]
MKRTLLVIDMLNDFCSEEGVLALNSQGLIYAEPIIPLVKEKILEAIKEDWQLIFISDNHEPDDEEFKRFPLHCVKGTDGAKIIEELTALLPPDKEVHYLTKQRYSSFYNTNLDELLAGVEEVHVVGVCTNICVLYTVEELCNRDMNVTVYREGVASFDEAAHDFALNQMETVLGARVV